MKIRKLNVFLADLIHTRHINNYCVPLNVGYIAARLKQQVGDAVETTIFKFPDNLIEALKTSPPDVLGLSNYDWNYSLNKAVIQLAREVNPNILIIMGGPNVRKNEEELRKFLIDDPMDIYVINEGEDAFSEIIKYILGQWPCNPKQLIFSNSIALPGSAYLETETQRLIKGDKPKSASAKDIPFPSPWLTGILDPYLNETSFALYPLIETNRNCPYQCHFCVWGDFELNNIRLFDFDTVIEELRYIIKISKFNFNLTIADANFGILKRDLAIAEEVRRLSDMSSKIDRVFIAQAKNSPKRNLEISKILGKICVPEFAVQTLTEGILEHSGRKNMTNDAIRDYVAEINSLGNQVMTDIMLGLPGESKNNYIESMKKVIDFGFQRASVADIRLLKGSVYDTPEYREKYGIDSRFRVIPSSYGEYGGLKVIEYEECIRRTNTMSTDDFLELRIFNAVFFLLYYIELGRPLLNYSQKHDLHPIHLIADVSRKPPETEFPLLLNYFNRFNELAESEWFESPEKGNEYYQEPKMFEKIMDEGFPKLNYDYAAQLVTNFNLREEFLKWVGKNVKNRLPEKSDIIEDITLFCIRRMHRMPINNQQDTIEISMDSAKELTEFTSADYQNKKSEIAEDKRIIREVENEAFRPLESLDSDKGISSLLSGFNKDKKFKINFDVDEQKIQHLQEEIYRNGGDQNLDLAIQVILQKNQRAFLKGWSP